MKAHTLRIAAALAVAPAASAAVIDDFSGDLSAYTSTVILDAGGTGSNTAAWQITGGQLELNTSAFDGIEQSAFIYNGLTLAVGQELRIDLSHSGASQDLGLYVGGVAPTTGVRSTYVAVYARGNGQTFSRGFNGTTELGLAGGGTDPYDSLFILRSDTDDYELGYYNGATRTVITTRTDMTGNDASFVGIYADVRAAGTLGSLDNLAVVPEPSTALLGLLGGLGLLRRRRA